MENPYTYTCLTFPDKETYEALCPLNVAAEALVGSHGIIYSEIIFNDDGTIKTNSIAKPGFHVNVAHIGELDIALTPYIIPTPQFPKLKFAGQE